mgnify:CR=1 FL=1
MTHSKTEIDPKLQKRIFILGFSVVVFSARRAPGKCRLWKKGIQKHWSAPCEGVIGAFQLYALERTSRATPVIIATGPSPGSRFRWEMT